ncbi:hypothetical protein TruAng_004747 [Truncatella angustata]|nr:hypothetical protein TruAng_004747 [Truncatella angustata]
MGGQSGTSHSGKHGADAAHERTALLGAQPQRHAGRQSRSLSRSPGGYHYDTEEDELDERESELLLARTASISSAGLAPETPEGAMFQHRQRRMSTTAPESPLSEESVDIDYDAEAAEASGAAATPLLRGKLQSEYLISTDYRRFVVIFLSIMLGNFVAIFDGTIMASSHPVITSYFHSSNSASWLSTAFLLTSTAFQPLLGRLSDSFGRKPLYVATMAIFAAATAWCGLADSMEIFILARAVCGLGAGGMMALGTIIISDLVPIERRGTYQSYVNVVYGLGSAAGAALGGLMADTLGWRWEFGVQVPAIILCLVAAIALIPADIGLLGKRDTFMEAMRAFDFKGSILLTTSTTFLILGLNLGGNILPWSHPFVIASLIIFIICFPACLWAESRAKLPIMPLDLLRSAPRANMIFSNFLGSFLLNAILFNVRTTHERNRVRRPAHRAPADGGGRGDADGGADNLDAAAQVAAGHGHGHDAAGDGGPEPDATGLAGVGVPGVPGAGGAGAGVPLPGDVPGGAGREWAEGAGGGVEHAGAVAGAGLGAGRRLLQPDPAELAAGVPGPPHHRRGRLEGRGHRAGPRERRGGRQARGRRPRAGRAQLRGRHPGHVLVLCGVGAAKCGSDLADSDAEAGREEIEISVTRHSVSTSPIWSV